MTGGQINSATELLAEISYGAALQELIGELGDYQIETIRKNSERIVSLLNKLDLFGTSGLELCQMSGITEGAALEAVIAQFFRNGNQIYVFLTTDARPGVVSNVLSSLPQELKKAEKEFVFFGYQDPELNKTDMNGKAELKPCLESGITLPQRYIQVYNLLVSAAKIHTAKLPKVDLIQFFKGKHPRGNSILVGNGLNQLRNNDMGWDGMTF